MCYIIWRDKISLLYSASKFVATLCLCQKLNEVLPAPRLMGGALCTDMHLVKPNSLAASQDLATGQRSVPLNWRKWKQRQEVIQNQKNRSPGPWMKLKGKASGITRKYSKARQPDRNVEVGGEESVRGTPARWGPAPHLQLRKWNFRNQNVNNRSIKMSFSLLTVWKHLNHLIPYTSHCKSNCKGEGTLSDGQSPAQSFLVQTGLKRHPRSKCWDAEWRFIFIRLWTSLSY